MLQNKYTFNQSSVELQVKGLPDLSMDDNKENISIISSWKLSIINQPDIEGSLDHLKTVINSFYEFALIVLSERNENVKSNFIDISSGEGGKYNVILKSSKPDVKPLIIKIGKAEFADIINCFDQLKSSENIKFDFKEITPKLKKQNLFSANKKIIIDKIVPPILAVFSISFVSFISIYLYEFEEERVSNVSIINKN